MVASAKTVVRILTRVGQHTNYQFDRSAAEIEVSKAEVSVHSTEVRADLERRNMRILATVLILLMIGATAYAADVDGAWAGTVSGAGGDFPVVFNFKADGATLTGTTTGPDGAEVQIKDGKIDGKTITFTVTFDFGGMPLMLSYKGIVASDQIMMAGDAFGMPFEFTLKKAK
jgi:hypothetical protein